MNAPIIGYQLAAMKLQTFVQRIDNQTRQDLEESYKIVNELMNEVISNF